MKGSGLPFLDPAFLWLVAVLIPLLGLLLAWSERRRREGLGMLVQARMIPHATSLSGSASIVRSARCKGAVTSRDARVGWSTMPTTLALRCRSNSTKAARPASLASSNSITGASTPCLSRSASATSSHAGSAAAERLIATA